MRESKPRTESNAADRGSEPSPLDRGIEAGALMPGQFVDMVRRRHVIEGESKLLIAVLEDAIRLYLRNMDAPGGERRREFLEVSGWFAPCSGTTAGSPSVFSFESLCAALDIDAARLRDRLRELSLSDLPSRRYQMRRHRPLSSLRALSGRSHRRRVRPDGS
jgi:hypothetical protein